jgi:ATP phosphoribosyltransferase
MSVLRLAIQKSGRLAEESLRLISECGIRFNRADNKLKASASNFPLELLYLRDDDIPEYVAEGVADIGIVGENVLREKERACEIVERLGFGKCRLSIALPEGVDYGGKESLAGLRIATTYPKILRQFLQREKIPAEIREIRGSAEVAPSIGLADAVCDLVSSGSTLLSHRLKEVCEVMRSEAVLISSTALLEKATLLDRLLLRIRSVRRAQDTRYILLNAPNDRLEEIISLLPGLKSPTVLPLATPEWCSVHSVVREDDCWEVVEKLTEAGAQGILVVPVEKMFA